MADLDDFFAKKDKKKGKSKKFSTSELKQLEQTAAKEKEQNKNNEELNEGPKNNDDENDDEWKEFEESKRPDLSNLKLGHLTLDEEQQNQSVSGNDNESESIQYNDGDNGGDNPWKKANQKKESQKAAAAAPSAPTLAAVTAAPPPAAKPGIYVAPRGDAPSTTKARSKKNAPDLKSEEYFPSLGTEKPAEQPKIIKKDGFKEVTHGVKKESQSTSNFQISVSSGFSSLSNNEVDS